MSQGSSQGGFEDLIGRALVDKDFRDLLYSDRPAAIQGYSLSDAELQALDGISQQTMEQHAAKVAGGQKAIGIVLSPPQP